MNIISLLLVNAPHDLWTIIINWIQGSVLNYGWTIILFTILIKFVLTPLDFGVKYTTKKQTLIQKKCAPQIAKLQKKYGADTNTIKVQTNSLYKREGMNMGVGCIITLVNMVLTMVIFFTLYSSLRKVSAYEAINQYEQIETSYTANFYQGLVDYSADDDIDSQEKAISLSDQYFEYKSFVTSASEEEQQKPENDFETKKDFVEEYDEMFNDVTHFAITKAQGTWNEIKETWLWIDNIWVADSPTSPFPNYASLKTLANNGGYGDYVSKNIDETTYNLIASNITGKNDKNGYYILAILAGVVTFLSQFVMELSNNLKNKKANKLAKSAEASTGGMSMKIMKIIMPIIMIVFVLTTSSAFGIYILASNLASILFGTIISLIIDRITRNKRLEVEEFLEKEANRMIKKGYIQEKKLK